MKYANRSLINYVSQLIRHFSNQPDSQSVTQSVCQLLSLSASQLVGHSFINSSIHSMAAYQRDVKWTVDLQVAAYQSSKFNIHIEHLYSASKRELSGAPDSRTAKKSSSLRVGKIRRWHGSIQDSIQRLDQSVSRSASQ